jgi:hypothetical protein
MDINILTKLIYLYPQKFFIPHPNPFLRKESVMQSEQRKDLLTPSVIEYPRKSRKRKPSSSVISFLQSDDFIFHCREIGHWRSEEEEKEILRKEGAWRQTEKGFPFMSFSNQGSILNSMFWRSRVICYSLQPLKLWFWM